ncbi:MAG: PEP-CTERM sorting domain-containing protein [Chthoniobacteraceae bacterium]|nr:PEP-CTERM sorting domain-containing protein [Chthoniobacteraceae bacterium]
MKSAVLAASLLLAPIGGLHAELTSVRYTFDSENNSAGVWVPGPGSWTTTHVGANLFVGEDWSASKYISYNTPGAGFGGTAWIANAAGTASLDSQFSLEFSLYSNTYWGTLAGFGNAAFGGISVGWASINGCTLQLGSTVLGNVAYAFTANSWYDLRLDVDLAANSGEGSASVFVRPTGNAAWIAVTNLSDVDLNLTQRGVDPSTWNTLWFHEEGAGCGVDNVSLTVIPEPTTWSLLAAGGLLLLARPRHRKL